MIGIVRLQSLFKFVANESQSGKVSNADFELACESIQLSIIRKYFKLNNSSKEVDEIIEGLRNEIAITSGDDLPVDYLFIDSVFFTESGRGVITNVEIVDRSVSIKRQMSAIEAPTGLFPICTIDDTEITVIPSSIGSVMLSYIESPSTPRITPLQDLLLPEFMIEEVLKELIKYFGISAKDGELSNFAALLENNLR